MWLERFKAFTRTTIWRFTLIFTALVLLICLGMLTLVYQFTLGEQKRQLNQQTQTTAQGFIDLAQSQSMSEQDFHQIISQRINNSTSLVIALATQHGMVGNLAFQPTKLSDFPTLQRFPIAIVDHLGEASVVIVLGGQVNTQFGNLVIGLLDDNSQAQEEMFFSASAIGLTLALIVTLISGFMLNRRVLYRVNQIGQLTADVKAGRLKTRLPLSSRNDEFDTIALQINQMLDEIDGLIDSIAQVTDNVAHDLRTPLSRIRITVEDSLAHSIEGSDDELWRLNLIDNLDTVIETFNAMLELSRLEKGVQTISYGDVNLQTLCEDVIDLALPMAEAKEQVLELFIDPMIDMENFIVNGEGNLLFRAFFNVIENAIKYTHCGGNISLSLQKSAHRLVIVITDNGAGISEEQYDAVFQRLYRVDTSRHGEGFGLGLPIVKAIIELHHGTIALSSAKPGLVVTMTIS